MDSDDMSSKMPSKQDSDAPAVAGFGKGVLKSSIGVLGGRVAQPFFTFFLFFVSARILTTGEFGFYVFLTGMLMLFQNLATLGLGMVLSREIGQKPQEEGASIGSVLCLCFPASILAGLIFIGLSLGLMGGENDSSGIILLSALSLPFSAVTQFGEVVFLAHSAGGRLFRIGLVEQIVRVGLSITALLHGFGLYGLIGGYTAGRVLAAAIMIIIFFKNRMSPPLRLDRGNLAYVWGRLAAFLPMNFLANLYFRADIIVLAWLMTDSDLGLYGCAMRIASFSFIIPESLVTASYPHFSRLWTEKNGAFEQKLVSYSILLLGVGFLGAAGMAFFGGTLLDLFFGAKYAPSGPLLALLGFMLPANGLNSLIGYLLQAAHREKTALLLMVIATVFVFSAISLGTILGGLAGGTIGTLASVWALAILHLGFARKVWRKLPTDSPITRSIAIFAMGWLIIALVRPADNLTFCLMAMAVGLAATGFGGLAGSLTPGRVRDVFR